VRLRLCLCVGCARACAHACACGNPRGCVLRVRISEGRTAPYGSVANLWARGALQASCWCFACRCRHGGDSALHAGAGMEAMVLCRQVQAWGLWCFACRCRHHRQHAHRPRDRASARRMPHTSAHMHAACNPNPLELSARCECPTHLVQPLWLHSCVQRAPLLALAGLPVVPR